MGVLGWLNGMGVLSWLNGVGELGVVFEHAQYLAHAFLF